MAFRDLLPFTQAPTPARKRAQILDVDDQKALVKLFKVAGLALGFTGSTWGNRTNFESSPYDFDRIIQAIDTDSFVKQAFNKYKELMWNEGWDIVGENVDAVEYVYQRFDMMEFAMRRSFHDFLTDVGDQLVKFGNCFVAKSRGDWGDLFPGRTLQGPEGKDPVIGYYIIPTETVEIKRDKHNKVLQYRQGVDHLVSGFGERNRQPTWKPEEVIHFCMDKKPGRAFGTPFVIAAIDDIISLRQMEEDALNLFHKELFPLYKYKVGTEDAPAEPDEIEHAINELNNMRSDSGLVLPERHDVEVVGAEGAAFDGNAYLDKMINRVCSGLGLSPHHLGLMMGGGNRAVTDRLDIALYIKVKGYQRYMADEIRREIITELLMEGGFDPITTPKAKGRSDRCLFRFREIDVDTQVKKETHEVQKFAGNITTIEEARLALNLDPEVDEEQLLLFITARSQPEQEEPGLPKISTKKGATFPGGGVPSGAAKGIRTGGGNNTPVKPDAAKPSSGGAANVPNAKKGPGNIIRPANQHGRRTSPNIRHDDDWLDLVEDLLNEE